MRVRGWQSLNLSTRAARFAPRDQVATRNYRCAYLDRGIISAEIRVAAPRAMLIQLCVRLDNLETELTDPAREECHAQSK
jgi:hypothetical protein